MPVACKNCDYLSPHNSTKYAQLWQDVDNGQERYTYNKGILLARNLGGQYQQYNKTIYKLFLEGILLFCQNLRILKNARGIIKLLFKTVVHITSEVFSAFITQRESKALYKPLFTRRRQQKFQINQLEYLEEAVTLYGTYIADSIKIYSCRYT